MNSYNGTPFTSDLDTQLYEWAQDHLPAAEAAIDESWDNPGRVRQLLGRVLRRRADCDWWWLEDLASGHPAELLVLATYMPDTPMPGGPAAWICDVVNCATFTRQPPLTASDWELLMSGRSADPTAETDLVAEPTRLVRRPFQRPAVAIGHPIVPRLY